MDSSPGVVEKHEKASAKFVFSAVCWAFLLAAVFISNTQQCQRRKVKFTEVLWRK